jgi:hypothetical protein
MAPNRMIFPPASTSIFQMRNIAKRESVWTPLGYRDRHHVPMPGPEDRTPQRSRNIRQEEAFQEGPNQYHIAHNILTVTGLEEMDFTGLEIGGDELLRDSTSGSEIMIATGGSTWGELRSDLDAEIEMERNARGYTALFNRDGPVSNEEEMVLDPEMSRDC